MLHAPISIHYICNCNLQLPYFLIFICGGLEAQIKHKRVTGSGLPESLLQLRLFNIITKRNIFSIFKICSHLS